MSISTEVRYEQAFKHWHLASEIRFKILAMWLTVYGGLFAVFAWVWVTKEFRSIAFIVPLLGVIATMLFWFMDDRNGGAIRGAKELVEKLENEAKIPAEYQLGILSDKREGRMGKILLVKHYIAINSFAGIMIVLLTAAATYLGFKSP